MKTAIAAALAAAALLALGSASVLTATPAGAKSSTASSVRFVNMAVTPDYPAGTAVDVYGATNATRPAVVGGKITAAKPAPKKLASKLAFGTSTKYLPVPVGTVGATVMSHPDAGAYCALPGVWASFWMVSDGEHS